MINIRDINIDKLEKIGSGTYGVVYRDGCRAIKIYNDDIKVYYGCGLKNPSLRFNKEKLSRLKRRNNKIEKTDLIKDIVYDGNKYVGVVYPYYEGTTLDKCLYYPLQLKIDISREIVNRAKELVKNKIYPLDYKLNNIIYTNEKIQLLDLDDCCTKVRLIGSNRLLKKSNLILDETIKTFLGEYDYYRCIGSETRELILNKYFELNDDFDSIENYLNEREKPTKFLLVNYDTELDVLKSNEYKKLYIYDQLNENELRELIDKNELLIYDVIKSSELDKYLNTYNVDECIDKRGKIIRRRLF